MSNDKTTFLANLRILGDRRRAALQELENIRQEVEAALPKGRQLGVTWREMAEATSYTENRLQSMGTK